MGLHKLMFESYSLKWLCFSNHGIKNLMTLTVYYTFVGFLMTHFLNTIDHHDEERYRNCSENIFVSFLKAIDLNRMMI